MKKFSTWQMICGCLISAFLTLLLICVSVFVISGGSEGIGFLSKMNTLRRLVDSNYIGETNVQTQTDSAAVGLIEGLDDRWSYYMTAQEYVAYRSRSENTSTGIGISIVKNGSEGFLVAAVSSGSPADKAGVVAGQTVIGAVGEDVRDMELNAFTSLISSQSGDFELELKNSDGSTVTISLSRETYYTVPVSYELLDNAIGYVRIDNFEEGSAENAISAIESLISMGTEKLIFDVRSNPGGRLSELVELLDYILPEGDVFVSVDKNGSEKIYGSGESCIEMEMVVLINENSYSAAEFFAAALREYDYAILIGSPSTGKGRSQVTYEFTDGSALHISTRRYLTPNRVDLSEQGGLIPDIQVEMGTETDTQLEEATKYLS